MKGNRKTPLWRRFVTALLILAAVVAAAFTLATTRWFQEYLRRRAVATLERVTGGRAEIAGFHFRPLRLEADAERVMIHGMEEPGEPPLFAAHQVEVRVYPWPLAHFELRLRSLSWASASLHIRTMPDGGTNIPGPATAATSTTGIQEAVGTLLNLSVRRARLANTEIVWNSKRVPLEIAANNLTLELRGIPGRRYGGWLGASPVILRGNLGIAPPVSVESSFTLGPKSLKVHSFLWRSGGLEGTAVAAVGWSPSLHSSFKFTAHGQLEETLRALHVKELRNGQVEMAGEGTYDGSVSLHGRALAQALDFHLPGLRPVKVNFATEYGLDKQKVRLARTKVGVMGGTVEGNAAALLSGPTPEWTFRGTVKGFELQALLASLTGTHSTLRLLRPAASLSGALEANWRGLLQGFRANFDFGLSAPHQTGAGVLPISGKVTGEAAYARSFSLAIKGAGLQTPHSTIQAHGQLGTRNLSLQVAVRTSDFNEWRPIIQFYTETSSPIRLTLEEPATFKGTISGTLALPAVAGQFDAGRFEFRGAEWDGFQATARLAPDAASLTGARLRRGSSTFKIDASATLDHWKFGPQSTVHLALGASRSPVEALRAALGIQTPVSGLLSGDLSLGGTRDNLQGRGRFEITKASFGREKFDSASARFAVAHSVWTFDDVIVRKGRASATGNARIDFPKRVFSISFHGEHLALADLFLSKRGKSGKAGKSQVQGLADFELHADGPLENPQGTLSLKVAGLRVYGTPIGKSNVQANIVGRTITASVTATGPGGNLNFSGKGMAAGDWPVSLAGSFNQVRLDPWIEALAGDESEPPISLSGYFSLGGPLKDPSRMEGHAAAESLSIEFPNFLMRNEGPVAISYLHDVLSISAIRLRGPGTHVDAQGTVSFQASPSISFDATGQEDAALLRLVDPKLHASGHSNLRLHIGGLLASPRVEGEFSVNDVNVSYGDLPFRVTGLNGAVKLEANQAVISNMSGTVGAGKADFSGSVTLGRLPRYHIQVRLSEVRIRYPSDFTSVLDGRLTLDGNKERGQLRGGLTVRNVFVNQNLNVFNLAAPGTNPSETPAVTSPLASLISLGVRVTSSPAVQIETRDVQLVADIDLRVQGTLSEPVVTGAIRARSGSAIFRGNRYSITRGEIEFSNPFRTEPSLDLDAQTRVQSYDLAVQVTGPFDQLRFSYRSDPPLPAQDILSLLAFGQPQRSQQMGTANTRSATSSVAASALLSEALSSQVSGRIQELFGVSRITIDPNAGGVTVAAGPVLTVEQRLSPDLTVTYATSTSNSQYRVIQFEWDLGQDVSLIGRRDYNGIFGLELRFRRRFK